MKRLTERQYYFYIVRMGLKSLNEISLYKQLRKTLRDKYEASELIILSR